MTVVPFDQERRSSLRSGATGAPDPRDDEVTRDDMKFIEQNPDLVVMLGKRMYAIRGVVFSEPRVAEVLSGVIKSHQASMRFTSIAELAEDSVQTIELDWLYAIPYFSALVLEYERRMLRILQLQGAG